MGNHKGEHSLAGIPQVCRWVSHFHLLTSCLLMLMLAIPELLSVANSTEHSSIYSSLLCTPSFNAYF